MAEYRYRAFISYASKDVRLARWLQKQLEKYRVLKHLLGRETSVGRIQKRLGKIFHDQLDLSSVSSLPRIWSKRSKS